MTLWTIIPRDPLIFRDGKPFNADNGARAKTLQFPFPSTIAGAMRTASVPNAKPDAFTEDLVADLLKKSIRGPLLVELNDDEEISDYFFPAPADALLLKDEDSKKAHRIRLEPVSLTEGEATDFEELKNLVAPTKAEKGKPHRQSPRYWRRGVFEKWLLSPQNDEVILDDIGHNGPTAESRMHVQIDPETGASIDGALFQTSGLEFSHRKKVETEKFPALSETRKLALAVESSASLDEGLGFFGGERRVAEWKKATGALPLCPEKLKEKIIQARACRLILLTPAYFSSGYIPSWLKEKYDIEIISAAVPRHQVISGWDYKKKKAKPTRKLVSAGSVYFLKLSQNPEKMIEEIWLQNISDGEQNRLDGFGLAILGSWDGKLKTMEVNHE